MLPWDSADKGSNSIGPALGKNADVSDGSFERIAPGVHGSKDNLIFQHQVTHDQIRIHLHGPFPAGNAGENKDAVCAQIFDHFER